VAWKVDGSKGICTIGDNVQCSGNNTDNRSMNCQYRAHQGGTFPGLPNHLVLFNN